MHVRHVSIDVHLVARRSLWRRHGSRVRLQRPDILTGFAPCVFAVGPVHAIPLFVSIFPAHPAMKSGRIPPLLVALTTLAGCRKHEPPRSSSPSDALPALRVQTMVVQGQDVPATIDGAGTIRPVQRAQLGAKVMGAIEELPVTLGQNVRAGDVLVRIAAGEIAARVTQTRAQLNGVRRDLERERALLAKGASTTETVKNLEDRVTSSEAQLREAEVMLGYAIIRAPFDGVVARKLVNAGDLAAPGATLLEVEGTSRFEVEAGVPESLTLGLKVGSSLSVEVPSAHLTFVGKVAELSSAADPQARTIPMKIAVPEGTAVRSGQFARVEIPGAPRRSLRVPAPAVTRCGKFPAWNISTPRRARATRSSSCVSRWGPTLKRRW